MHSTTSVRAATARRSVAALLAVALGAAAMAAPWDRFEDLPRAKEVREAQRRQGGVVRSPRVEAIFDVAGGRLVWKAGDAWQVTPLAADGSVGQAAPLQGDPPAEPAARAPRFAPPPPSPRPPGRGRQSTTAPAPDGKRIARFVDNNVVVTGGADGEIKVTTDGAPRLRYGCASWVYGEELDQDTAMWWSPDGRYLAFYRFDDRPVKDFVLQEGLTRVRPTLSSEPYPKPGEPNPIAHLMVWDSTTGRTVDVDVGPATEQYVYAVRWVPDSSALMFNRTNRHQDLLEVMVADPASGASRPLITERQETFQENHPEIRFLDDGRRFIWVSERSGNKQFELWDVGTGRIAELTNGNFPVKEIVRVDEEAGRLWYTAFGSETLINPQLFVAPLAGGGGRRLTPLDRNYGRFTISPDGRWFVATEQFVDQAPAVKLYAVPAEGTAVERSVLAAAPADPWKEAGLQKPEFFTAPAADGTTPLYGILCKPSGFDPSRKYPLLVDVYGGPGIQTISTRAVAGDPRCEFGIAVARVDNRGTPGRSKAFEGATYLRLGGPDIDDQAAAVKHLLATHPWIDPERVAITGHSYGGYATIMALLRHPETFRVGVAGAGVTDWRHYDSIYTERYMRTPQENAEGYDAGSAVKLAERLKGKLLLLHGMVDDNVHPTNAWQLVDALQRRNIPFEMLFFPDADHGVGGPAAEGAKWSFLLEHLGLRTP